MDELWRDIGAAPAADRLRLIADGYRAYGARQVLHAVPVRIQLMIDGIPVAAAAGDPGMVDRLPAIDRLLD